MNSIEALIEVYQPTCLQEEQDKKQVLAYCHLFDNLLIRENTIAHFSSSGFIVNRERTKTLFIHHKIYNTWCWTGGHVDGNPDFCEVALKEAQEETGLKGLELLSREIASLDIIPVIGHLKQGKWVSAHQHLSIAYVIVADEEEPLIQNKVETNGIKWVPFEQIAEMSGEAEMIPVYRKLLAFTDKQFSHNR